MYYLAAQINRTQCTAQHETQTGMHEKKSFMYGGEGKTRLRGNMSYKINYFPIPGSCILRWKRNLTRETGFALPHTHLFSGRLLPHALLSAASFTGNPWEAHRYNPWPWLVLEKGKEIPPSVGTNLFPSLPPDSQHPASS